MVAGSVMWLRSRPIAFFNTDHRVNPRESGLGAGNLYANIQEIMKKCL